jgi:hypothetical protein
MSIFALPKPPVVSVRSRHEPEMHCGGVSTGALMGWYDFYQWALVNCSELDYLQRLGLPFDDLMKMWVFSLKRAQIMLMEKELADAHPLYFLEPDGRIRRADAGGIRDEQARDLVKLADNLRWVLDKLMDMTDETSSDEDRKRAALEVADNSDLRAAYARAADIFRDIANRRTDTRHENRTQKAKG